MKKRTLAYLLAAASFYFIINSYTGGAGNNGWDCTGAETGLGNLSGCTNGSCHSLSVTAGIDVAIELDSAGVPTTHYTGGMNYTVKLTGTNNGTLTLPKFGFQMGCIKGSSSVTTPVNAGTWATPYPASTHFAAPQSGLFVVGAVEHSTPIAATTGTGGNGSTYVKTFNWNAPAAGTGTVSFWAVLNAVNGNGSQDAGDKWNKTHVVINEWTTPNAITLSEENLPGINIFPNPNSGKFTLSSNNNISSIEVYNVLGERIFSLPIGEGWGGAIDLSNHPEGIYFLRVTLGEKNYISKIIVE